MARPTETEIAETLLALRMAEPAARARRLRRSVSRWARFLGWWYLIPFGFAMAMLASMRLLALGGEDAVALIVIAVGGPLILGTLVAVVWAGFAARRELAGERAWLAGLPYAVVDYEECLGDEPTCNDGEIALVLGFAGAAPTRPELARFFFDDNDGSWEVSEDARTARQKPGPCGYNDKHNQRFAAWFHRVTIERLGPLHERFGLREVALRNERWDEAARRRRDYPGV